jgi:hypothetical protein
VSTDTELWAPDDAMADAGPRPPSRPCDLEAERILVATAIMQPAAVDELGAEGFDPADITTDWLRWAWFAVEELRTASVTANSSTSPCTGSWRPGTPTAACPSACRPPTS